MTGREQDALRQLDIFTPRRRPHLIDYIASISPRVRRAYIWDKLNGYKERQAKREQARKRKEPKVKQEGLFD